MNTIVHADCVEAVVDHEALAREEIQSRVGVARKNNRKWPAITMPDLAKIAERYGLKASRANDIHNEEWQASRKMLQLSL